MGGAALHEGFRGLLRGHVAGAQTFKKLIGEGAIGRVHLGRWQETDVAIKVRPFQLLC